MDRKSELIPAVLFWGSLWGIWEIFGEKISEGNPLFPRSLMLVGMAVLILTISRRLHNVRGFSLAMALLASLFKFLNAQFWDCQFYAVILLGITFEIGWGIFVKEKELRKSSVILAGVSATGLQFLLFVPIAMFTTNHIFWLANGGEKIWLFWREGLMTMVDVAFTLYFMHKAFEGMARFREKLVSQNLTWFFSGSMVVMAIFTALNV